MVPIIRLEIIAKRSIIARLNYIFNTSFGLYEKVVFFLFFFGFFFFFFFFVVVVFFFFFCFFCFVLFFYIFFNFLAATQKVACYRFLHIVISVL